MNLSIDQWSLVIAIFSLAVSVLVAAVPLLRRRVAAGWRGLARLAGMDRRRYRRWFGEFHGKVRNVYLDRDEELQLRDTYVPLAGYRGTATERVSAADVLRDRDNDRLVIIGDPGTGKSTLLKAFGTSLAASGRSKDGADPERWTPVIVPLRHLARWLDTDAGSPRAGLRRFIEQEILPTAKVRRPGELLGSLLAANELVLMLDGLDEVPDELRVAVRSAILAFVEEHRTRVVLTCRRQNFLAMRTDWIPALARDSYTLARLKDDEIRTFIARRERDFTGNRTPGDLFQSITHSGTLELHRIPLILTVSITLYTQLSSYRIPNSLTAFYDEMIKQLVTRHDFRLEVAGAVNRYTADDKLRFLREFAFRAATRADRFEDFSLAELVAVADELSDRLPSVHRGYSAPFVNEIVNRSGLLVQASQESDYMFAHRSIQEFLIARRLLGDPQAGALLLLGRANEDEWRLVATFFASFEHDHVETFLSELRARHPELAARCLAVANISYRGLAERIIDDLLVRVKGQESAALAALIGLVNATLPWVRELAVPALLKCLDHGSIDATEFQALDQDSVSRLIAALTDIDEPRALGIVGDLAALPTAESLSNIAPLWRIVTRELGRGNGSGPAGVAVRTLLHLCRTPVGLAELQAQPSVLTVAGSPDAVYPFTAGVSRDSNLPNLLAAAKDLAVPLGDINAYLDAVEAGDPNLRTLERDRSRRVTSVQLFWPMRVLLLAAATASVVVLGVGIWQRGWSAVLIEPGARWLNLLYLVPVALSALIAFWLADRAGAHSAWILLRIPPIRYIQNIAYFPFAELYSHPALQELRSPDGDVWVRPANSLVLVAGLGVLTLDGRPFWYWPSAFLAAVTALPLAPLLVALRIVLPPETVGLVAYLAVATAGAWFLFWFPATLLCSHEVRLYLRRRNPLIGLYDDPASRHWLLPQR